MAKTQAHERGRPILSDDGTERSTRATIKTIAGVIVIALLVLFLFQNLQTTEIHFLWFSWSMRVIFALLGAAIGGALATVALQWFRRRAAARRTVA